VEFKFKKPKSIAIGGSYSIKCVVKPDVSVDLFIQLPKVPGFLAINPRCCWLH
jgi:U3 small nucleolar RNA-associated protein 22